MKKIILCASILMCFLTVRSQTMSIDDFRQLALEHNKSIQIAETNVKAATELKKAAFKQFLPNVSANGAYLWNEKNISLLSEDKYLPVYATSATTGELDFASSVNNRWVPYNGSYVPLDASGNPFDPKANPEKILWKNYALLPKDAMEFDAQNIFVGSIGFTQPIFMGGKILEMYHLAKFNEDLAKVQQKSKTTDLIINVDEAYWRVVSVENKVGLATEYRKMIAQLDSNVNIMVTEGVATKADALKVRVKLNEADVSLTKAENGLSLSRMALNQLCGLSLDTIYQLSDADLKKNESEFNLISTDAAVERRTETQALQLMTNISKTNERLMYSRFMPTIALSGKYIVSNPNAFNGFSNSFDGMFNVGIVAHVPLFHFGERLNTLNAAKLQTKMANLTLEETKEKMELQIKQNSYKVSESLKKQIATKKNIENAEENLMYAQEGFDAGAISTTDMLGAQTAWLSAKSEDIDAEIDVRLCNLYLAKSQGLLEIPQNATKNKQQ